MKKIVEVKEVEGKGLGSLLGENYIYVPAAKIESFGKML